MHSGHRQRIYTKFLNTPEEMPEHEILEMILFTSLPRINTNFLAHNLLAKFGDISTMFSASLEDLLEVEGIGENTARFLLTFSEIINDPVFLEDELDINKAILDTFKKMLVKYFSDIDVEILTLFLLDKENNVIETIDFSSENAFYVIFNIEYVNKLIAGFSPTGLLISHNHLSGVAYPTSDDYMSTGKVAILTESRGLKFFDHIIVSNQQCFSLKFDDNLDIINNNLEITRITNKIMDKVIYLK